MPSLFQALQIAGRAGRFGTQFQEGEATTFHASDLITLKDILSHSVESIEAAGLHPTAEQIELFAYHLPEATLSNLIVSKTQIIYKPHLFTIYHLTLFKKNPTKLFVSFVSDVLCCSLVPLGLLISAL